MIETIQDSSVSQFLTHAGEYLYAEEAVNNLMLGICEVAAQAEKSADVTFFRVSENQKTVAAAVLTPTNLIVAPTADKYLQPLAESVHAKQPTLPGVVGPAQRSEAFAKIFSSLSGQSFQLAMAQRIYQATEIVIPKTERGTLSLARADDEIQIGHFLYAFAKESLSAREHHDQAFWGIRAKSYLAAESVYLWSVNGHPVSMAMASRPTRNGISIRGVYTPESERKNGYASAVVAHLSQHQLDSGKKFCVLYTDLANPTSNKIYQNVGYREVVDSKHFI